MKLRVEPSLFWLWVTGVAAFWLLNGCVLGPDYRTPITTVSGSFTQAPPDAVTGEGAEIIGWWKRFEDPVLTDLVDRAIAKNHDLRQASSRLKEVRALRRLSALDLFPTVQAGAGYADGRASGPAGTPRAAREYEILGVGFDASRDLDLFGRVRRLVEAANAELAFGQRPAGRPRLIGRKLSPCSRYARPG